MADTWPIPPAPAKASAAPYKVGSIEATGLCAALNLYYADEAKKRGGKSDVYEVQFLDPILSNAKVTPPGAVDKAFAGGNPNANAASRLDPDRQNIDSTIRIRSATAGQQIVQFIDEVMRSSSYISDQQKAVWQVDPATGKGAWMYSGKPAENFAWFNITCEAQVIGYDETARANVYKMIYKVAPYQTTVTSEYFAPGTFRGVHKVYNYWFTGQNTQVLQYEQSFNSLWSQTISSNSPIPSLAQDIQNSVNSNVIWKKRFMPASNQSREGAEGDVFEAAANAADNLYTQDLATISLNIIGDPAWIESPKSPQPGAFVVSPFFPDGTINYGAGVPYFEFAWNRPVDYNLETGLMDPGQNNYFSDRNSGKAGNAQQSVIYMATGIKSMFKGGKFTQELKGAWLRDGVDKSTATTTTPDQTTAETARLASKGTLPTPAADTELTILARNGTPVQAGVQKTAESASASIPNQYPTAQSTGNLVTSNNNTAPQPASPPPANLSGINSPPKLGGYGTGSNNPSVAGISAAPQLVKKENG